MKQSYDTQQTIELAQLLANLERIRVEMHTQLIQPALHLGVGCDVDLFNNLASIAVEMREFQANFSLSLTPVHHHRWAGLACTDCGLEVS